MDRMTGGVAAFRVFVEKLARMALYLGMGWVLVMMLVTTLDVAGRYFLSRPLPGAIELGQIMLAVFGILGMAYTHFSGANVKVTMLTRLFGPRVQSALEVLAGVLCLQVMLMLTWYGGVTAMAELSTGTTTDHLKIPIYPLYWLLSVGAGLLSLVILSRIMEKGLAMFGRGQDQPPNRHQLKAKG